MAFLVLKLVLLSTTLVGTWAVVLHTHAALNVSQEYQGGKPWKQYVKDFGLLTQPGNPNKPLYLFFLPDKDSEAEDRFQIGSRLFCWNDEFKMAYDWACDNNRAKPNHKVVSGKKCTDQQKKGNGNDPPWEDVLEEIGGSRPCPEKHNNVMKSNAIPLRKDYSSKLATQVYDGEVVISTHSGDTVRQRIAKYWYDKKKTQMVFPKRVISSGDDYGTETFFYNTYIKPLLMNPQRLNLIIMATCNSGTRFRKKFNNDLGASLADRLKLLIHQAIEQDPTLNDGHEPELWGANGYMWNWWSMGGSHSVIRVHEKYCEPGECTPPDAVFGEIEPHTYAAFYSQFKTAMGKKTKVFEHMFLEGNWMNAMMFPDTVDRCRWEGSTGLQAEEVTVDNEHGAASVHDAAAPSQVRRED